MLNDVKHVVAASECSSLVQAPADSGGALGGVQGIRLWRKIRQYLEDHLLVPSDL